MTKTNHVFKTITILAAFTLMGLSLPTKAADGKAGLQEEEIVIIPLIKMPNVLNEGTQRTLTPEEIATILPWAKDSKVFLVDLLDNIQNLNTSDKVEFLITGIKEVVGESAPKRSELLMRYVLNRGLVINDILNRETDPSSVGISDVKLRALKASILMAIKYYDNDFDALTKKGESSLAAFGIEYYYFLSELNKSVFDASAQYSIQRLSLEFLQWDLYRDLNNAAQASRIVKINNALKTFKDVHHSDAQSIALIRQMKALVNQLRLTDKIIEKARAGELQEFESLLAQKKLVKTIADGVAYAEKALGYVRTPEDFFRAISPGIENPNAEYKEALASLAYDKSLVLIQAGAEVKDVRKLLYMLNNVDKIVQFTRTYIPKIKNAQDYLTLFSFTVSSPTAYYIEELRKLATEHMPFFMGLNPTQKQQEVLLGQFR